MWILNIICDLFVSQDNLRVCLSLKTNLNYAASVSALVGHLYLLSAIPDEVWQVQKSTIYYTWHPG